MYIYDLVNVMDCMPGVPVVVTQKTHEEQIKLWQKWGLNNVTAIKKKIGEVDQIFTKAGDKYPDQIFVINYMELVENTDAVIDGVLPSWSTESDRMTDSQKGCAPHEGSRLFLVFKASFLTLPITQLSKCSVRVSVLLVSVFCCYCCLHPCQLGVA